MKRRRWVFNLAAAVSLALCIGAGALWIRSFRVSDTVINQRTDPLRRTWRSVYLASSHGRIFLSLSIFTFDAAGQAEQYARSNGALDGWRYHRSTDFFVIVGGWRTLGFYAQSMGGLRQGTARVDSQAGAVPLWFVMLLSSIAPGYWLKSSRRQRVRLRNGQCLTCGYDLRATPARCPECGTASAAVKGMPG